MKELKDTMRLKNQNIDGIILIDGLDGKIDGKESFRLDNHAVFGMTNGPVAIGGRVCAVSEPRDKILCIMRIIICTHSIL